MAPNTTAAPSSPPAKGGPLTPKPAPAAKPPIAPAAGDVQPSDPTISQRFTSMIMREFSAIATGTVSFDEKQQRLAHHMYQKIDATLKEMETKRLDLNQTGKQPIVWANVNMQKLALDSMHRIELGLDALITGHVYPIPYWNSRGKKYDLDLRIGHTGKDYYRRKMAIDAPKDVRYELVYTNDTLIVYKKSRQNPVETYDFDIKNPFDRGEVKGGFAYLVFEDESKNRIVLLSMKDFNVAKAAAKSPEFWNKYPEQMQLKTLVHRATDKLQLDPDKVNASFLAVESDDSGDALEVQAQIEDKANKGGVINIKATQVSDPVAHAQVVPMVACPNKDGEFATVELECAECQSRTGCPAHAEADKNSEQKKKPGF